MCSMWGRMASCSGLLIRLGLLVGQGHALPRSWASSFSVGSKPRILSRLRQRDQKTAGKAWPCPTKGPVPQVGKLSSLGITSCKRSWLCIR
jgi:hypothetical protein